MSNIRRVSTARLKRAMDDSQRAERGAFQFKRRIANHAKAAGIRQELQDRGPTL